MSRDPAAVSIPLQPLRSGADFERFVGEFTNYEHMKEYRYAGDTLSLERMEGLARDLGSPHARYRSIHVAGTKGKGTTSLILESLLSASGLEVGTYTSPHVEHLRERIRFSGEPVTDGDLCALTNSILPVLSARLPGGPAAFPTFFELMTALAMLHFENRRAEWAIFEVGLGGRLDATNILRPRWTAITSIGLEHTDKLGHTLGLIAAEKAGIIKPSTPVVVGPLPPEAEERIRSAAREKRAPFFAADPGMARPAGPGLLEVGGGALGFATGPIAAGAVRGPGLRTDLCLALELWRGALAEEGRSPRPEEVALALERLRLPARVEVFMTATRAVIDAAHTPESVEALRLSLEEIGFPRPRSLVFALAADKPAQPILEELLGIAEEVVFTRADPSRSRDPQELADLWAGIGGSPSRVEDDPEAAFRLAERGGRAVVVTGSFYLAGRLRPLAARRGSGAG
jgi:dihydrofolate synthase/folylpolyglutamate synthase